MIGRRSDRWDALCILALTVLCLLLRLPGLGRLALNPDESQYEATAAYLLASGASAFELPHTSGGSFALWKLVSWIFGATSRWSSPAVLRCGTSGL